MAIIEFQHVGKSFNGKTVLNDLNLSVREGETITIIGGSGSGKSVTLKLLLGLIATDRGKIFFKGQNIPELDEEELVPIRAKIGMLFQGAALFDSLTVYENIVYPLREHHDYSGAELDRLVAEKLAYVGLKGVEDMYPADLSGGMKKRVGLARAIATNPEVILYDEPTTGLDPANTNRIDELIRHLQAKLKLTSIVVTHDMASAFKVSDRIALLHEKRIEFVGTVDEVRHSQNAVVRNFIEGEIGEI